MPMYIVGELTEVIAQMARPSSETLTPRETQIMSVLWSEGSATAERVREALPNRLHNSTVRTRLRVLETKGYVRHASRGRTFVYRAVVARVLSIASIHLVESITAPPRRAGLVTRIGPQPTTQSRRRGDGAERSPTSMSPSFPGSKSACARVARTDTLALF